MLSLVGVVLRHYYMHNVATESIRRPHTPDSGFRMEHILFCTSVSTMKEAVRGISADVM